jgi:hypothetical protein
MLALVSGRAGSGEARDRRMGGEQPSKQGRAASVKATEEDELVLLHRQRS